jgi:hypothetical protein
MWWYIRNRLCFKRLHEIFPSYSMGSSDVKGPSEVCRESQHTAGAAEGPPEQRVTFGLSARHNDHGLTARFVGRCVAHHQKLLEWVTAGASTLNTTYICWGRSWRFTSSEMLRRVDWVVAEVKGQAVQKLFELDSEHESTTLLQNVCNYSAVDMVKCLRSRKSATMYVRMYVCMYVCICVYVRTYACIYVCMYVCMCVCNFFSITHCRKIADYYAYRIPALNAKYLATSTFPSHIKHITTSCKLRSV